MYNNSWNPPNLREAKKAVASATTEENFETTGVKVVEKLEKYLKKDFSVIDYGCGVGRMMKPLSSRVKMVIGIDISKKMLKFAKEYCDGIKNIKFVETNGINISLESESIDFCICILVLQHMEKEDAFLVLCEIQRVLKKGRKIFFSLPNFSNMNNLKTFEKFAHQKQKKAPHRMRMYTSNEIEIILNYIGFEIENDIRSQNQNINFEIIAKKI